MTDILVLVFYLGMQPYTPESRGVSTCDVYMERPIYITQIVGSVEEASVAVHMMKDYEWRQLYKMDPLTGKTEVIDIPAIKFEKEIDNGKTDPDKHKGE